MYIVTGGAGFIGSAFVWKLNQMGITDILVVDNLGETEKWKNLVNLTFDDYIHKSDFIEALEVGSVRNVDAIVHMGACSSTTELDADYLMENNLHYTQYLAQYCLDHKCRFIYASSAATYGDGSQGFDDDHDGFARLRPLNMYGYSKQLFDLWALKRGMLDKMVGIKFFNVYGPNEYHKDDMKSVVCKAYHQIRETGALKLFKSYREEYGHGEQKRDFVYIKDCLDIMAWFLEHPEVNGVFNLGTGQARTWNDLAKSVFAAMNMEPNIQYIDMPESLREKYQYFTQANMQKLRNAGCDLHFTSLEDAIKDYIQNYLDTENPYLS